MKISSGQHQERTGKLQLAWTSWTPGLAKSISRGLPRQGILALALLGAAGVASAASIPASTCTFNDPNNTAGGFQCSLYPSDGSGNFDGNVTIPFPSGWSDSTDPISPGYIVLDSNPSNIVFDPNAGFAGQADDPNQSDWAQVLEFVDPTDTGASAEYMTLFTIGCNSATNPNDTSCFPGFDAVTEDPNIGFVFLADPNPAVNNVYNFVADASHSYAINFVESPVPEPATFAIAFGGIAVLVALRRRRKSSR